MLREPLFAARRTGTPSFVHVRESLNHDSAICSHIGLPPEEIIKQIHILADKLIANSSFTYRTFYKPEATYLVRNALNVETFDASNSLDSEFIKIALISSNLPKKGVFDFIQVAQHLELSTPNAHFLLIGPENEYTQNLIGDNSSLPSNFTIAKYTNTPQEAIEQANIVVNLSHFEETFGRTILEAMAAGRPVIAYNHGALADLISHGENGLLVPYLDIQAVADSVNILCKNPEMIVLMGAAGRAKARAQYSLSSLACSLSTVLRGLPDFPEDLSY